jgi:hypothetical protein
MSAQQVTKTGGNTMNATSAAIEDITVGQRIVSRKYGVLTVTRSVVARNPRTGSIDPTRWALQAKDKHGMTWPVKAVLGTRFRLGI